MTTTHKVFYFIIILLKALSEIAFIPFYNSNQGKSIYNEKGVDAIIIIKNAYKSFFLFYGLVIQDESGCLLI